jgi:uncharacterized membrane protein
VAQTEIETRASPTGRVEAFSNGVMPIAITALVLRVLLDLASALPYATGSQGGSTKGSS